MAQAQAQGRPQNPPRKQPPPRLGPRPLPQHLSLAAATWLNSATALPGLRLASQSWATSDGKSQPQQSPNRPLPATPTPTNGSAGQLRDRWQLLLPRVEAANPADLAKALQAEGLKRFDSLLTGVERYRHHPYRRDLPEPPVLWQQGTTRLLDYRVTAEPRVDRAAPRLLVIPSLVNRYYILDLEADASFLRHMARQGMAPFVVDWGSPGEAERNFDFGDYVLGRLDRALEAVKNEPGGPVFIVGYCMGGNLALALALRRQSEIAGLVALATPWDFHAENAEHALMLAEVGRQLEPVLQLFGELPVDLLQCFFSGFDPFQVLRKFQNFAALDPTSAAARKFVALEDWLNDGMGLAAPVARECFVGWYGENCPAQGKWLVGGEPVDPRQFAKPSLNVIPAGDRIVPPKSALALADALPGGDRIRPAAGHIGMMAGRGALPLVWEPLTRWVRERAVTATHAP